VDPHGYGGNVEWDPSVYQIRQRVIIGGNQREWSWHTMLPGGVKLRKRRAFGMEDVSVNIVLEKLCKCQRRPMRLETRQLTPRVTSRNATDLAIAHGIGIVLLKLNALRTCTCAKKTSRPPSNPAPRITLKRLQAAIFATRFRPARPGSASSPCDLISTETVGTPVSNSKNTSAGNT
jgi:hypothetical protein